MLLVRRHATSRCSCCSRPNRDTPAPSRGEGVFARCARHKHRQASGRTLSGDEGDSGADVDVAVIDLAEAGPTPEEVHLTDQHPIAARGYAHDLRKVPDEVRALHTAGEGNR